MGKLLLNKSHIFLNASGLPSVGLKPPALGSPSEPESGAKGQGPRDPGTCILASRGKLRITALGPRPTHGAEYQLSFKKLQVSSLPEPAVEVGDVFTFHLASLTNQS